MNDRGQTTPQQGEKQERSPRQPHERDESAASQSRDEPSQEHVGAVAHDDAESNRSDTSKAPEMERAYDKLRDAGTTPPTKDKPVKR
jgi:hypothetical protein